MAAGSATEAEALLAHLPSGGRVLAGEAAVRHAVVVATGRDSIVLGEDQILHQLREAVRTARTAGDLDPATDRLFAMALQAGRQARSWQSGSPRSLADVALEAVDAMDGAGRHRDVLVVGAGIMGGLLARVAARSGASVTIANRSAERARSLAASIGAGTTELDPGSAIGRFDAILVALGGPWTIGATTETAILDRRPAIVDLSVPSAVPAGLAAGLGSRLVTADDLALHERTESSPDRGAEARTDALIDRTVQAYLDWQARGDARSAADALVRRADREREAELAALWRRLPALDPEAREAIEGMTRHLAARLLRQPLERLGRDSDGIDGQAVRDLFAL